MIMLAAKHRIGGQVAPGVFFDTKDEKEAIKQFTESNTLVKRFPNLWAVVKVHQRQGQVLRSNGQEWAKLQRRLAIAREAAKQAKMRRDEEARLLRAQQMQDAKVNEYITKHKVKNV